MTDVFLWSLHIRPSVHPIFSSFLFLSLWHASLSVHAVGSRIKKKLSRMAQVVEILPQIMLFSKLPDTHLGTKSFNNRAILLQNFVDFTNSLI